MFEAEVLWGNLTRELIYVETYACGNFLKLISCSHQPPKHEFLRQKCFAHMPQQEPVQVYAWLWFFSKAFPDYLFILKKEQQSHLSLQGISRFLQFFFISLIMIWHFTYWTYFCISSLPLYYRVPSWKQGREFSAVSPTAKFVPDA